MNNIDHDIKNSGKSSSSASTLSPTSVMYKSSADDVCIKSDGEDEEVSSDEKHHPRRLRHFHLNHEWTFELDLQLAAELGKTLLQRNQELERDLGAYQDLTEDQALEIDFLTKQVQLLRDESGTRLTVCEMLESQLQELKRSEGNLQELRNLDYMRITRLQDTVEVLQTRCDELQTQVTEMKRKNWEDKFAASATPLAQTNGMTRSISHGDALKNANNHPKDDSDDENGPEVGILKEKVKVLQRQVADERKQRELLQNQVSNVATDNTSLWQQLDHVTNEAANWREKLELLTAKYSDEIVAFNEAREKVLVCEETGSHESQPNQVNGVSELGGSHAAPQLSILDEIADSLRDRFLDDLKREQEEEQERQAQSTNQTSTPAVSESKHKCKTTQTDTGLLIEYLASHGADPTHGRFERGPPEYKRLFKEIFDIIKKSREEDAARAVQPQRQRGNLKQKKMETVASLGSRRWRDNQ